MALTDTAPGTAPGTQQDSQGARARVGVTGLAVMGANLARNLARHGHVVAVHNRTTEKTRRLVEAHGHEGDFVATDSTEEFVAAIAKPRTVIVMVQAGPGTDAVIDHVSSLLEPGDVLVDCGNAHFADTRRREAALREKGIAFVGAGVSGGEVGALEGPSIMPGGAPEAYGVVGPLLESIAAVVDGTPCCTHVGPDGAGHFVKMVHNGIEYADMQLIAEAYDLLRQGLGMTPEQIADVAEEWNRGDLESYLIEITADVLRKTDARTGGPLVDVIRDAAEQKGTGRWTVQIALELGVPVSGIAEAVFARSASGHAEQREPAQRVLTGPGSVPGVADRDQFLDDVRTALYASKILAYAQGFDMIRSGGREYGWDVDLGALATIWRGGCIIRARFLDRIREAYEQQPDLPYLALAPVFAEVLTGAQDAWRRVIAHAVLAGVATPGFSAALASYDTIRAERLPAALIQGLRDRFGSHGYARTDDEGSFHTDWSGDGSEQRTGQPLKAGAPKSGG